MVTFTYDRPVRLQDVLSGRCRAGLLSLFVVMLLSACTLQPIVPDTPTPAPEQEAAVATVSAAATPLPTETPTPLPTATSEPLRSVEIFEKVSPAIVYVDSPGLGSGILIEGGYVVTEAELVLPSLTARLVLSDGTVIEEVPLRGWDLLADLAVLGPVATSIEPLALHDGEGIQIGANVYHIGHTPWYAREPQLAIAHSTLSQLLEWEAAGITYFLTDAADAADQRGGVLVSENGAVIGISSYITYEGVGFTASSADMLPRIQQLIAGGDPSGLGERRLPAEPGAFKHEITLENNWDQQAYLVNAPVDSEVSLELDGEKPGMLAVLDATDEAVFIDDPEITGVEMDHLSIDYDTPHYLIVSQYDDRPGHFTLTSSHRLALIEDPDDGQEIRVGEPVRGNIDFSGDTDRFLLRLEKGETVEVVARSALIDPALFIDYLGDPEDELARDYYGGGGLFGLDARIVYRAGHTGDYLVVVADAIADTPGGYIVTVEEADAGAGPVHTTMPSSSPAEPAPESPAESLDGFGEAHVKAALADLLDSFTEVDPHQTDASIEELEAKFPIDSLAIYLNIVPFQVIMVATGELDEAQQDKFDKFITSESNTRRLSQAFFGSEEEFEEAGIELHRFRPLEMSPVGDVWTGGIVEYTQDGHMLPMEILIFRRGNIASYIISFGRIDTPVEQSAQDLASALDEAIVEYLAAE